MDKLESRARLTATDWRSLVRFVAAQDVRTPLNFIESMKRWGHEIPEILGNIANEANEAIGRIEEARDRGIRLETKSEPNIFADSLRIKIEPLADPASDQALVHLEVLAGRKLWIASMRHILTGAAEALCKHRWSVLEPDGDEEWPLTDHPVLRLNYYQPGRYDFCGGWNNPGSEVIMPVSPQHLLYVRVGEKAPNRLRLSQSHTRLMQTLLAERATGGSAKRPAPWVAQTRPRIIDLKTFEAEKVAWEHWHEQQLRAESPTL